MRAKWNGPSRIAHSLPRLHFPWPALSMRGTVPSFPLTAG
jgi:hypothetical protein